MYNNEPTLEKIEDYNTLKGQKRRIVWAVILSGLILGGIFWSAKSYYGSPSDTIPVSDAITKVPLK